MDNSHLPNRATKLSELLDLALGTPDPGSVNFGILYVILSHIIRHLHLSDAETDVEKSSYERQPNNDVKLSAYDLTPGFFHNVQKRLSDVELKLQLLNSLPNNKEIIDSVLNENTEKPVKTTNNNLNNEKYSDLQTDSGIPRKVTNLWQTVQTSKRLDATEEGLHRLSSLTDDLLEQIKKLSEQNKLLKTALEEALVNSALRDQLAELTRKLGEIEKRQNQEASLLQNVVHMDALRGLVFWHTLGKSITGIDYLTACAQVNSKPHPTNTENDMKNESTLLLTKCLPEEFLECPDPDLSSTLRKLGNVASGFDSVVNRVEQLETLMKQKADRNELDGLGVPSELYEKIYSLEAIVSELAKEREKVYVDCGTSPHMPYPSDNKKLLKKLQDTMGVLQEQINQLNNTLSNVQSQFKKVYETVEDVKQYADDLETRKADANYVDIQLEKKANSEDVKNFLSRSEFQSTNQTLKELIEDLFGKLTAAENELKSLLNDLQEAMENKMDRDEIDQLREWLEKRFKALNKRFSSFNNDSLLSGGQVTDDAAGLRRSLMQHFHCISCDRPLEVALSQEHLTNFSTDNRGFPVNKSIRPYTTFDLESLRHHIQSRATNKSFYINPPYRRSNCNYYDVYGTPRQCGGTYTTVPSSKLKARATTCKSSFRENDGNTTKSSIQYTYRETLDLQGMDGHIYRGSPIQESQRGLLSTSRGIDSPTRQPMSKDDDYIMYKDIDKGEKLPPVTKSARYVNTVTNKSQAAYKFIGSEKREKSQSPQRLKRVNSEEFQVSQSSPTRNDQLPQLIIGSTQLPPNQRVKKIQPVQPNSKSVSDHVAVKPNGYAVIVVPNTGSVEEVTLDLKVNKSENNWTAEKSSGDELNVSMSPTYMSNDGKDSSIHPSPTTFDNNDGDETDEVGEVEK
uniref:DUF4795 domain-containing protein n=1 Tax=Trichobilharzia regenti TaxID=157069 RepID=A0AA85IVC7_TRIRE|nr:unnamed protein product [Trichobilharzia regenti]